MSSEVFLNRGDDPGMIEAQKRARRSFRIFWREWSWEMNRIIPGLALASVKVAFQDPPNTGDGDDPQVEHMWLSDVGFNGKVVTGTLLNQPNWLRSVNEGDDVRVSPKRISDWMYGDGERVYGAFTVQHMRSRMPPRDRKQHDEAWGLEFGDPETVLLVPPSYLGHEKPKGLLSRFKKFLPPSQTLKEATAMEHPMAANCAETIGEQFASDPEAASFADEDGLTHLHRFAMAGSRAVCEAVVNAGADRSAETKHGLTPANVAKVLGWKDLAAWLAS